MFIISLMRAAVAFRQDYVTRRAFDYACNIDDVVLRRCFRQMPLPLFRDAVTLYC